MFRFLKTLILFQLVVGSESFDIRIFKDDLLLYEITETDAVIGLCDLGDGIFAYALVNGTLGAYSGNTRLWRIKSKSQAVALRQFPDPKVLVCAWIHGKVSNQFNWLKILAKYENLRNLLILVVR